MSWCSTRNEKYLEWQTVTACNQVSLMGYYYHIRVHILLKVHHQKCGGLVVGICAPQGKFQHNVFKRICPYPYVHMHIVSTRICTISSIVHCHNFLPHAYCQLFSTVVTLFGQPIPFRVRVLGNLLQPE